MTAMIWQSFVKHLQDEYWAYIALFGVIFLYTGIMVCVFGFSDIIKYESGAQIGWLGVFFVLSGIALLITSGVLYHRKQRRLRPCICCGTDMYDVPDIESRSKRRLRFAPNLISPYYEQSMRAEKTMYGSSEADKSKTRPMSVEIDDETDNMSTWVDDIDNDRLDTQVHDYTTLVSPDGSMTQITKC